ncbi:hypothetical protein [Thalassiella azotivora]
MDLRSLVWRPGAAATILLVLEWSDGWAPTALERTPFVVMEFTGATVLEWVEDDEPPRLTREVTQDPSGQVSGLDWDGASTFTLQTLNCRICFRAASVRVDAVAGAGVARWVGEHGGRP